MSPPQSSISFDCLSIDQPGRHDKHCSLCSDFPYLRSCVASSKEDFKVELEPTTILSKEDAELRVGSVPMNINWIEMIGDIVSNKRDSDGIFLLLVGNIEVLHESQVERIEVRKASLI